ELSMRLFMEQQQHFSDKLTDLLGQAQQPVHALKELADRQVPIWRMVRKEFLKNLSRAKNINPLRDTKNDGQSRRP
ncbi:MAG: polyhydroxyalkanoate synthesis repressor PhaR, partial [Gammaproteobacteria bacterium]|nr:polyhydroxyalkanoate synthesis repressor PhaR [Gammaproteobacteria bacterium]